MPVLLKVNGRPVTVEADAEDSLLSVLRDDLALTGAKYGCGEGQCGACTVLVEGRAVRSCVTKVSAVTGRSVTTIEGLAAGERLHVMQEAFLEVEAFQCGYCTPGMVLGAVALLKTNADPSERDIARGLDGHVCRCGSYPRIVRAVQLAAQRLSTPSAGGAA